MKLTDLNLSAAIDLLPAVLPSMLEQNPGTIIWATSRAAIRTYPSSSVVRNRMVTPTNLNLSKAALLRFMEILNVEYNNTDLRFFAINPASVLTRIGDIFEVTTKELMEKSPAMKEMLTHSLPLLKDKIELPVYTILFLAHPDGRRIY